MVVTCLRPWEALGVVEREGDGEGVRVLEGVWEGVGLLLPVSVAVRVGREVRVLVEESVTVPVAVAVALALRVAEEEEVAVAVALAVRVAEEEEVAVALALAVRVAEEEEVAVAVPLALRVELEEEVAVAVPVDVRVALDVPVAVAVPVRAAVALLVEVPVPFCTLAVPSAVALGELEDVRVAPSRWGVGVGVLGALGVASMERAAALEGETVEVPLMLGLAEAEACAREGVADAERDGLKGRVNVGLGEALVVPPRASVGEGLSVPPCAWDAVACAASEGDAEAVPAPGRGVRVEVGLEGREAVGLGVPGAVLALAAPWRDAVAWGGEGVGEKEIGAEAQALTVAVLQAVEEAVLPPPLDAVGAPVALPMLLPVAK